MLLLGKRAKISTGVWKDSLKEKENEFLAVKMFYYSSSFLNRGISTTYQHVDLRERNYLLLLAYDAISGKSL